MQFCLSFDQRSEIRTTARRRRGLSDDQARNATNARRCLGRSRRRVQMIDLLETEGIGQGAGPGPISTTTTLGLDADGVDDVGDDLLVDRRVLTETRLRATCWLMGWSQIVGAVHCRCAMAIACSTATKSEPGSARPVPASSSAVP